ncbi:MAG: SRPBCC family protein [Bacteroidota bacterium]
MNEFGKLIDGNTLQFKRILPGTLEQVWEYLVDDRKRSLWFAGGPTELKPNGKMDLIFNNSQFSDTPDPTPDKYKDVGDGFKSTATILEVKKPVLLVIDWEGGNVKFELSRLSEGNIELTLTHEKLPEDREYRIGTFAGWHTHLNILFDRLNSNKVKGFWTVHMQLEEEYGKRLD